MVKALLGTKIGMSQVYDDKGVIRPVTVIAVGPCQVTQVRTKDKDGYDAVQIGYLDKKRKQATKAEIGHVKKVGENVEPKKYLREVRLKQPAEQKLGDVLTVEIFNEIASVDVIGTMKGRGTSGVMKRHGFSGLETGHGVQRKHRAPGSIGQNTSPGHVHRGRRMGGQYGNCRNTVRNLTVVRVDKENNCLLVLGGVPGPNGGLVMVRQTNRIPLPKQEETTKAVTKKK